MDDEVWMLTATGKVFHPFNPQPHQICMEDIVQKLSRICRFGGGVKWPLHYSVAEHSVLLAQHALERLGDPQLALQLLMHDAAEAYIGDMIRPLKEVMPEFRRIDNEITEQIFAKYNIPYPWPALVDELDVRILIDEEAQVMAPHARRFEVQYMAPVGVKLQCWDAVQAHFEFMQMWMILWDHVADVRSAQAEGVA